MAKFSDHMEKITEGVTGGYQKIEDSVVGAYKKVESAFVDTFLAKEGESVGDAKTRIAAEQKARDEQMKAEAEKRAADQRAMINASLEKSKNAGNIHR